MSLTSFSDWVESSGFGAEIRWQYPQMVYADTFRVSWHKLQLKELGFHRWLHKELL